MGSAARPVPTSQSIQRAVDDLKAQGAPDEAIHAYLQSRLGAPVDPSGSSDPTARYHRDYASGALQRRMASENATDEAEADVPDSPKLAAFTNVISSVPGAPDLITGGWDALEHPSPLADTRPGEGIWSRLKRGAAESTNRRAALAAALQQSNANAEADSPRVFGENGPGVDLPFLGNPLNPKWSTVGKIAVNAPLMAALPGSPAVQAGLYGAAHGTLNADPDASAWDRIKQGGFEGALGLVLGKGAELASTGARAIGANASRAISDLKDTRSVLGAKNFGTAETQGKIFYANLADAQDAAAQQNQQNAAAADIGRQPVVPPHSPLTDVLNAPGIKPFTDIIRNSGLYDGADDATLAREAYKLMSEAQGKKLIPTQRTGEFAAGSDLQLRSIGAAKAQLVNAADEVMPEWQHAIDTHRIVSGDINALRQGYGMVGRGLKSGRIGAKDLGNPEKDPTTWASTAVPAMDVGTADAARTGVLGGIRANSSLNPLRSLHALTRGATLLRAVDPQAGGVPFGPRVGVPAATMAAMQPVSDFSDLLRSLLAPQQPDLATEPRP